MPEGIPYASSNVVASAGLELNYIGRHCYAYSGGKGSTDASVTYLDFTSGNYYADTVLTVNGAVEFSGPTTGLTTAWKLEMNGAVIGVYKTETNEEDMPGTLVIPLLIPPYTEVKVTALVSSTNSDFLNSCSIIGRVYR